MKIENAHVYFIGMNDITISNVNDFFGSITIERTTGIKNNICYSDLFLTRLLTMIVIKKLSG